MTAKSSMKKDSRPSSKTYKGHTIPYGTLVGASEELRQAYYYYGYKEDSMMPELPCPPEEDEPYIDPEEEVFKNELAEHVQEMLDTLSPRMSKVLKLRFGIGLDSDYTLEEVGTAFRVTRERIRQIEVKALRYMKHPYRSDVLRQFYADNIYKTTAQRQREIEERQKEFQAERDRQFRLYTAKQNMSRKKRDLWEELKPALADAPWVSNLKTAKPKMYQELKELVGGIWGMSAKDIWKKYTREDL